MKPEMPAPRRKYVPVVGPRLKQLLAVVFGLFAVLVVNSAYLVAITIAGVSYQNYFYMLMFLAHLVLGLALVLPFVIFGIVHIRNSRNRPNKRAIRAGWGVYLSGLLVFVTGFVLMRVDIAGIRFEVNQPLARSIAYWAHVIIPLVAIWAFVLHRLAGRSIKWKVGLSWAAVAAVFALGMVLVQSLDPRAWNQVGPASGEQYFFPAFTRTTTGNFIPAEVLDADEYCLECHADVYDQWSHSAHRFSSFNNPVYEFSIKETRRTLMERDGSVKASRFCAGCHDPVPFLSGAFDDPRFDDPNYDVRSDPLGQAGVTCTACHAISHVNTVRGNGDYTIDEPVHYPFAFSTNPFLRWVNRQLVKAKPEFHKATFLKPLHRKTEFCGTCHKVHIPEELNQYKWLRGQNHFDTFWLSGVSGYGVTSFYYPPKAEKNCNDCHMPLVTVSDDLNFSAVVRDESGERKTFNHHFPSANAAIVDLMREDCRDPDGYIAAHSEFNKGMMRVDIFGLRRDGRIDGELLAPLRPALPELEPGETYLLETVVRTLRVGHHYTQGTVDSNETWLDVTVKAGERVIGRSGGLRDADLDVDPWSHFFNVFLLDREGNRINRRNVPAIFVPLYNHQIPPGSSDVVHYQLRVPEDCREPITIEVKLQYRKFDTEIMRLVMDDPAYRNTLPVLTMAADSVTVPVRGGAPLSPAPEYKVEPWQRWNDYGIGLLLKEGTGQLRQALHAFEEVERLGRPDGPLNQARVYIREGLVQTHAPDALEKAARFSPPANAWSLLWFGSEVAARNGQWDDVISKLRDIIRGGFRQAEGRNFDFSKDYRVHIALGNALYQAALVEAGETRAAQMREAVESYKLVLTMEPESLEAHYGLALAYRDLGDQAEESRHLELHAKYRPDDNARDYAVAQARLRYPAASQAAEAVVIYDLQRQGAYGLGDRPGALASGRSEKVVTP